MELMIPRDENSGPLGMGAAPSLANPILDSVFSNANPPSKGRAFGTPLGGTGGAGKSRKALSNITNKTPGRRAFGDITNSKGHGNQPVHLDAVKVRMLTLASFL